MAATKSKDGAVFSGGVVVAVAIHAVLIITLLFIFHPQLKLSVPFHKKQAVVELVPPPPPPPPPEPPKPPPKTPPPPTPHPVTPPPPQPIQTTAQAPADTPSVPPSPPPEPPAPPAPPAPTKVGTSVPLAYFNQLDNIIQGATQYPVQSLKAEEEGTCKVRVHFTRDGTIISSELAEKTGFARLDAECREVFKRISKFPPIPLNAAPDDAEFIIELPINFVLQAQ